MSSLVAKFSSLPGLRKREIVLAGLATLCIGFVVIAQLLTSFSLIFTMFTGTSGIGEDSKMFDYNLWEGVKQLWIHGAYGLALIVTIFSGLMPYVKLLLAISPVLPKRLEPKLHRNIAKWMFIFGKWSLFDVWFVCSAVTVVDFDVTGEFMRIQMRGLSEIGVYLFLVSTICTQIIAYAHWCNCEKELQLAMKSNTYSSSAIPSPTSPSSQVTGTSEHVMGKKDHQTDALAPYLGQDTELAIGDLSLSVAPGSPDVYGRKKRNATSTKSINSFEDTGVAEIGGSTLENGQGHFSSLSDDDRPRRKSLRGLDSRTFRSSFLLLIFSGVLIGSSVMMLFIANATIMGTPAEPVRFHLLYDSIHWLFIYFCFFTVYFRAHTPF